MSKELAATRTTPEEERHALDGDRVGGRASFRSPRACGLRLEWHAAFDQERNAGDWEQHAVAATAQRPQRRTGGGLATFAVAV